MLNRNAQNKNGKAQKADDKDYYAVLIQLNYDASSDKAKKFFTYLYDELTNNFGFNFCDRVFYRVDSRESIVSLVRAAIGVISIQHQFSSDDIQNIIKHSFILKLGQFDDVKNEIII
jgi:hypothetical protein